jgi:hypothetical protein
LGETDSTWGRNSYPARFSACWQEATLTHEPAKLRSMQQNKKAVKRL